MAVRTGGVRWSARRGGRRLLAALVSLVVVATVLVATPPGAAADALPPDFGAPAFTATGSEPSTTAILDTNQDGNPDVVVLNVISGTLSVLIGDGTGAFAAPVDYSTAGRGTHMVPADMDADGIMDLVISIREPAGSRGVVILHGDGVGGFLAPVFVAAGPRPHFVDVGDLNGDGFLDIAVSHCCGSSDSNFFVQVLFGSSSGTFSPPVGYANGGVIGLMILLRDFDGDGDLDMTTNLRSAGSIAVWANDGTGTFPNTPDYFVVPSQSMAAGDLNDDGKPDLVVTDLTSTTMNVLFNTSTPGAISFAAPTAVVTSEPTSGAFVADIDGDDVDDAVVTHQSTGEVTVILGSASGSLGVSSPFAAFPAPNRGSAGDLDGDGRLDLAVSSQTSSGGVAILLAAPVPASVANCGSTSPLLVDEFSDDDGSTPGCSLREAVAASNALNGTQTIELLPGIHQLSILGSGEDGNLTGDIDIADDVIIQPSGGDATSVIVDGGAIDRVFHVLNGADATFRGMTITNGDAGGSANGGGILVVGSALVDGVNVEANTARGGGGIFFDTGSDADVRNSAIVNNIATDDGGGVESTAGRGSNCPTDLSTCPTRLVNVTVSGNVATQNHGGVSFDTNTDGYLNNVTITENSAGFRTGGLGPGTGGIVYVSNTAIAGNTAVNARSDCDVTIISLGHNFFSDQCAGFVSGFDPATDVQGLSADFGPLQLNDGTTPNHLPNAGSPLLDAGHDSPSTLPACEPADQRGVTRSNRCDIGAVEGFGGDETPPVITITTPADGAVFELGTSVNADYTCVDDDTSVASCVGSVASGASIDTSAIGTFTFTVTGTDIAGNSATESTTYEVVDSVLPEVVITTPADNATYEVGATVTADYSCADTGSGVASCVGDVPVGDPVDTSVEGTFTFTVTGTDVAGNFTSVTSTYTVEDTVDPAVMIVSPADGAVIEAGTEVLADYSCTDTGSGVASCVGDVPVGDPVDTSVEGTFTFTVTGTDVAGNFTSVTSTYTVEDTVDPAVMIVSPADGAVIEAGTEVLADYSCTDTGSGVASCVGDVPVGDPVDTSVEGTFTFTVTGTDGAGNTTIVTSSYTVVDTVDPGVTIVTPADGATYEVGSSVLADYSCTDGGTGVASCVGDVPVGDPVDTSVEGTFTFTVTGTDGAGNTTTVTSNYSVEDTIGPLVTIVTPADGGAYEIGSAVVADYSCTDAGTGVASCVGDVPAGSPVDTSTVGTFTFTVTGTDGAGNTTVLEHTYTVEDTGDPVVTITTPADGVVIEAGDLVEVAFTCTDAGTGVASCVGDLAVGAVLDTSVEGTFTFTVVGTDGVGNSTMVTHTYTVEDTGNPEVIVTTPADGAAYEIGSEVLADYTCTDASGVLASCVGDVPVGDPVATGSLGTFTFTVVGTDAAGNTTTVDVTYTVVDSVYPEVTIVTPADGAAYEIGSEVVADYTCTDSGSGVATCSGDVPVGDPIDTSSVGVRVFTVIATDVAGNITVETQAYEVVDTVDPVVTIVTPADGVVIEAGDTVLADYSCTDAGTGVASCAGSVAVGDPVDTTVEGTFAFTVIGADNAGNPAVVTHTYTVVDSVDPVVTISAPADGGVLEAGDTVTVDYDCTDAGTGVVSCVGDLPDGTALDTTSPGTYTFTVVGTDGAGNVTTVTVIYEVVDTVAPAVTIVTPADGAAYEVGAVVEADYVCTDAGSGVASCVGPVADGALLDTTTEGVFSFTVVGADAAGNSTTVSHFYTVEDSVAPEVMVTTPADGGAYEVGSVVEADYACTDAGSGVASCVGDLPVGASIDTSAVGTFSFTVVGTDVSGNETTITVSYEVVDTVAPEVVITTPADGSVFVVGDVVVADYACADAGTGVASCVGDVAVGAALDTATPGTFTFTVVGTDNAGLSTTVRHTYEVQAAKTIDDLIATIRSYDLRWGVEAALVVKAKIAKWQLDGGHERGALRSLRKLERWVRFFEGRKLTEAQATELIDCLDDLQAQVRAMINGGGGH